MKKFILILLAAFIAGILVLPLFSDASTKEGELLKDSAIKKSNLFEMTIDDNIISIKAKAGKRIDSMAVVSDLPWIPAMQFEKYRKYFVSGISIDDAK